MDDQAVYINNSVSDDAACLVIMPIFNRKNFLKQAFGSLLSQTMYNWRLLIIDDGSQDESLELVKELAANMSQPVTYLYQKNAGPGAARDKGRLFLRNEPYVAFFDSDDIWLPDYLMRMTSALAQTPDLFWLFCACKRVNLDTGVTLLESTHLDESTGQKAGFFNLPIKTTGNVSVFTDNATLAHYQIVEPLNAGFQNSVVKSEILKKISIPHYRIGEDRFFLLDAILNQFKIGFIEDVLVIYSVHQSNISDTNSDGTDFIKRQNVQKRLAEAYFDFSSKVEDVNVRNEILDRANSIIFWNLAYNEYIPRRLYFDALEIMVGVVFSRSFSLKMLKTFISTVAKSVLRR